MPYLNVYKKTVRQATMIGALSLVAIATGCGGVPEGQRELELSSQKLIVPKTELIAHWAPVHYQDVNKNRFSGKGDYITAFDYDGNWSPDDNWDNMLRSTVANLSAWVYTNITESRTHWFLAYAFYHPRDWMDASASLSEGEHENDMEATTLFVRKDGTQFGRLEGMITEAHGRLLMYSADLSAIVPRLLPVGISPGISWESVPGSPLGSHERPRTYQQAEGHGLYGCSFYGVLSGTVGFDVSETKCDKNNEDGIKYVPAVTASKPNNVGVWTTVGYGLRSMNELWEKRTGSGTSNGQAWSASAIFKNPGFDAYQIRGGKSGGCGDGWFRTCSSDAANMYWGSPSNTLARDPAKFIDDNFVFQNGLQPPSRIYLKNDLRLNASGVACRDMTTVGGPMDPNTACDPGCAGSIVNADPFCGQSGWDGLCIFEVETICGSSGVAQ